MGSTRPTQAVQRQKHIEKADTALQLREVECELITRSLLKDYRVVFGGEPIAAPARH